MGKFSKVCSVEGCGRKHYGHGFCAMHWKRWRTTGDPGPADPIDRNRGFCEVDDCDRPHFAKGMCSMHYHRDRKNGTPGPVARTTMPRTGVCITESCERTDIQSRGMCGTHYRQAWQATRVRNPACSVNECDREARRSGMCGMHAERFRKTGTTEARERTRKPTPGGYIMICERGEYKFEHRRVMEASLGRALRDFENVHHRNGNRADNRPENLELWTKPQPCGQRPDDLVEWVVTHYPELVRAAVADEVQLAIVA